MTIYETITDRIISQLEAGNIPWRKPWKASAAGTAFPHNRSTGKSYRGVNIISLLCSGYSSSGWLTYKQAQEMGAQVRKGEKGSPVVFWKFDREKNPDTGKEKSSAFMRAYTVFNVEQIDGLQDPLPFDAPAFNPIESADRIVSAYLTNGNAPSLAHGGDRAFYQPSSDRVQMPLAGTFTSPESYYLTLFHEFGHSTGHKSRLDRKIENHFGDAAYSDEELCAEFAASFVSAEAGISNDGLLENSAAYIRSWIAKLRNDPKMAVNAAQRAQRAADLIIGRKFAEAAEAAEVAA